MSIQNKNILITGASGGIGRAIALYLAKQGANLGLIDLKEDSLQSTAESCKPFGGQVLTLPADVTKEEDVELAIKKASDQLGPLSGLVNNAGILRDGLLVKAKDNKVIGKLSLEKWQSVIDVNLTGVFLCGREAAVSMIESGSKGVIINISSIARTGNFGQSNYASAKAGVVALTTTWSKELSRYGIRAAAIAPGMIETEMTMGMKQEARDRMNSLIPSGRMGKTEEIANAVAFILNNEYFNGRTLEVDGGLRL